MGDHFLTTNPAQVRSRANHVDHAGRAGISGGGRSSTGRRNGMNMSDRVHMTGWGVRMLIINLFLGGQRGRDDKAYG